ncbi:MAG: hypothetical protein ORN85_09995 [Sediminibacterium sp.]|nr:hypothetical protein [Sediminibacterium sp.]
MKGELIHEFSHKNIYESLQPNKIIVQFQNDQVKSWVRNYTQKGIYNNKISNITFDILNHQGIPTPFIERQNEYEQIWRKLTPIPIKIVVRNFLVGTNATDFRVESGHFLPNPILEFFLIDPYENIVINDTQILSLAIIPNHELQFLYDQTYRINKILFNYWDKLNMYLVDFELYFGKDENNFIYINNELTPDYCSFWEKIPTPNFYNFTIGKHLNVNSDIYLELYIRMIK